MCLEKGMCINIDNPFNYGANEGYPTITKIQPPNMNEKYKSNVQKCVYLVANYLKIHYLATESEILPYLKKLNLSYNQIKNIVCLL